MHSPVYDQPEKLKAREAALRHAVQSLTRNRESACCVPREYVRAVKRELIRRGTSYDGFYAEQLPREYIKSWEAFHRSHIGVRRASELTVCYLAGPNPLNDFRVLTRLGVLPHNIWAFESEGRL